MWKDRTKIQVIFNFFQLLSGFCGDCVKNMKKEYLECYNDYLPIKKEYEMLFTKNMQIDVKVV